MNGRIRQVVIMLSEITGLPIDETYQIALSTDTGKAIESNNPIVLYEQNTDNLYAICMELRQQEKFSWLDRITTQLICDTAEQLPKLESKYNKKFYDSLIFTKNSLKKEQLKKYYKIASNRVLQSREHNLKNVKEALISVNRIKR